MKKSVIYIHGKGGSAAEAEHYEKLFPDSDVIGFDYKAQTPWEAKKEFGDFFDFHLNKYDYTVLIANSIGAFFALHALADRKIDKALLISPVVDMENLIGNMMRWANVSEKELFEKREIATNFGETLSWEYLCYVRENPINRSVPTCILYGEKDNLTSFETVSRFSDKIGAALTVMPDGEHWFHTESQMRFLDDWVKKSMQ